MVTGVRRDRHLLSAWCLWQHRKVPKRNRIDARLVCQHRTVKRVFPWTRSSSCETPVSPDRGFCRFRNDRRSPPYWRGGSRNGNRPAVAGFTRTADSALDNLSLDRRARRSGDVIGRSREINFRDSRPWAAGLPVLEVDPVASEAVEVLLPLVEVLLSSVPPDGDLSGVLKVQKTLVRVQAAADIVQTSAAPGVPGEQKIPVRVVVGAADNGGSSGEANSAVVAEHNRPTTKTISQLPRQASTEPK